MAKNSETGVDWESNLCIYDDRHPYWNDDYGYLDPADVPEPRKDCYCDNCFYGRDALAVAHLEQIALIGEQETNPSTEGE